MSINASCILLRKISVHNSNKRVKSLSLIKSRLTVTQVSPQSLHNFEQSKNKKMVIESVRTNSEENNMDLNKKASENLKIITRNLQVL